MSSPRKKPRLDNQKSIKRESSVDSVTEAAVKQEDSGQEDGLSQPQSSDTGLQPQSFDAADQPQSFDTADQPQSFDTGLQPQNDEALAIVEEEGSYFPLQATTVSHSWQPIFTPRLTVRERVKALMDEKLCDLAKEQCYSFDPQGRANFRVMCQEFMGFVLDLDARRYVLDLHIANFVSFIMSREEYYYVAAEFIPLQNTDPFVDAPENPTLGLLLSYIALKRHRLEPAPRQEMIAILGSRNIINNVIDSGNFQRALSPMEEHGIDLIEQLTFDLNRVFRRLAITSHDHASKLPNGLPPQPLPDETFTGKANLVLEFLFAHEETRRLRMAQAGLP